ncbi:MAG: ribosome silencing factor [Clostridia bacterium]|nr:ribosome silencing factor [Clostridia bacterium]
MDLEKIVETIVKAAEDKKARDIKVLDLRKLSSVTDYFIICTGNSATQNKAIADNIEEKLAEAGVYLLRSEGYQLGSWILLDYGDAVVHIFKPEEREFYSLERLWGDAREVEVASLLGENDDIQ